MPLSPLLSNLVLSDFDKKMVKSGLSILRYADDIICFCDNEQECITAKNIIEKELKRLELSIPSLGDTNSKTAIHSPEEPVIFLGVEVYRQKDKYNKKIPIKTWNKAIEKVRQHSSLEKNVKNGYTLSTTMKRLSDITSGYSSAFASCTNLSSLEDLLKKEAEKVKLQLLNEIFGPDIISNLNEDEKAFIGI